MRNIEEPKVHCDGDKTTTTHPAYGQVSVNRYSGRSVLYGSDFVHHCGVGLCIKRSVLRRNLSHDWHYARDELIEVRFSEAQWATLISSLNHGDGTPCTITHINMQDVPGLPNPIDRSKQFAGELDDKLQNCIDAANKFLGDLKTMGLPKGKTATISDMIEGILRELQSNLPFVAKSFGEHTEAVTEKAKQEIHGYMMNVINRAGMSAIASSKPLELPE